MHVLLHSVSPSLQQTTTDPCLCWRIPDTHRQVWVSLLWGHCSILLKEVTIIFITSIIVWPQVNSRERAQLHPSTENWIKDLQSMALPLRARSVSHSASLSHQEAPISLLSFSIRWQIDWKSQSQKTNQSNHMDHSLSNSMKLWAMLCKATQDGHGGDFWQNVVHWRREQQATSVFLPWEHHEQYEKAKS